MLSTTHLLATFRWAFRALRREPLTPFTSGPGSLGRTRAVHLEVSGGELFGLLIIRSSPVLGLCSFIILFLGRRSVLLLGSVASLRSVRWVRGSRRRRLLKCSSDDAIRLDHGIRCFGFHQLRDESLEIIFFPVFGDQRFSFSCLHGRCHCCCSGSPELEADRLCLEIDEGGDRARRVSDCH